MYPVQVPSPDLGELVKESVSGEAFEDWRGIANPVPRERECIERQWPHREAYGHF